MDSLSHWWELVTAALGSFIGAVGGVLLRRSHKYAQGDEHAWSRVWLDAPTVFVMGLIGAGVGQWLTHSYAMPELFGHILSAVLGYLGPASIDRITAVVEKWAADKEDE